MEPTRKPSVFPQTRWTRVCALKDGNTAEAGEALAELCQSYWQPIYLYIRSRGYSSEDAEDFTQEFIYSLIRHNNLVAATPEKGRLRSFLLGAARRFLADEYRKTKRQKRGGDAVVISIDQAHAEERFNLDPVDRLSPDRLFDRAWTRTVIDNVQAELAAEFAARERSAQFEALRPYIVKGSGEPQYSEIAAKLDMTEAAVRAAVTRLRKRYRTLFRNHVADTLHEDADIDAEIRELFAALQ